jgi:hypothetical protein
MDGGARRSYAGSAMASATGSTANLLRATGVGVLALVPALSACVLARAEAPVRTIDDVVRLVKESHATSVDDAVAALPESLRTSRLLLGKSESAQPATEGEPRVIPFDSAGLVLTFAGGSTLELMEFDKAKARFSLAEVSFDGESPRVDRAPSSCADCHGSRLRPRLSVASAEAPVHPGGLSRYAALPKVVRESLEAARYAGRDPSDPARRFVGTLGYWTALATAKDVMASPDFPARRFEVLAAANEACSPRGIGWFWPWLTTQFRVDVPSWIEGSDYEWLRERMTKTVESAVTRAVTTDAPELAKARSRGDLAAYCKAVDARVSKRN